MREAEDIHVPSWLPITGYDGLYEVSDQGAVRRIINTHGGKRPGLRKPQTMPNGYLTVQLSKNCKLTQFYIHRLVAGAFHPNPFGLPQVAHNNGIRYDNRALNLRWSDCASNSADMIIHGTSPKGERNGSSKLTGLQVRSIKAALSASIETQRDIARKFGVCFQTINDISLGKTWRHV